MTSADVHLRAWADQAIRPVIREILRDELADLLPTLSGSTSSTPETEKPLNLKEAAKLLGCAEQTVYQNIKKLPHKKRFGKLFFFESELLDYLKGGEPA